jgi:hypothetical protein
MRVGIRFVPATCRVTVTDNPFCYFPLPMHYTLGQAAKATGVPKPRLSRAINKGQISAARTESGGYLIDPAELHRVFPPVTAKQEAIQERYSDNTPLLVRIEELINRLSDKDDVIRDLRLRLDDAAQERQRLTLLLTHQAEHQPSPPKGFWAGLFG